MNSSELKNANMNEAYPCCIGFAAIQYRNEACQNTKLASMVRSFYVLNGRCDSWFRVNDKYSPANGYGICLRTIKITGRNPINYGSGMLYKAAITYINDHEQDDSAPIWLFVHNKTTLEDVLAYIEENKNNWEV